MGFSAGLLQLEDWAEAPDAVAGEGPTVQYEFESIREPGHATGDGWGDFFVFHVDDDTGTPNIIWRTDDADGNVYKITPGTYDHAFWAFTQPGTYVFQIQVKGHPRGEPAAGGLDDFEPLIEAETVTSEVRRYTFHVGDLAVNHDPIFEVERPVAENSAAGTDVGEPICVKDLEDDTACFTLSEHGAHENFTIIGSTDADTCGTLTAVDRIDDSNDPNDGMLCAQIQVKEGASLDFETTASYDLILQVSDGKDHESNKDPAPHKHIDDSIAVRIAVEDDAQEPVLTLTAPERGEVDVSITLSASWSENAPSGSVTFAWFQHDPLGEGPLPEDADAASVATSYHFADTVKYRARAQYEEDGVTKEVYSNWVSVAWD